MLLDAATHRSLRYLGCSILQAGDTDRRVSRSSEIVEEELELGELCVFPDQEAVDT